jgi:hypothetical protein
LPEFRARNRGFAANTEKNMAKVITNMLFLSAGILMLGASAQAGKVLVLPLAIDTTRIHDYQVVQDFFFEAVEGANNGNAVRGGADSMCIEKACALERNKSAKADQVIFGAVRFLGRKCFFTGNIIGADGANAFSQTINMLGVADFENGTKRMAEALLRRIPIENSASIDNITDKEQLELDHGNRRRSFYSVGGSIGYLYPFGDSYQRWKSPEFSYLCTTTDPQGNCIDKLEKYRQMAVLSFDNWFEFRSDLAMELNFVWDIPLAVGVDANLDYLFGKSDFTPFLGGGIGLHYVGADEGTHEDDSKTNSGPTVNIQGGMIFFRTYTINPIFKLNYHVVLNDDKDNGMEAMLGIRTKF